MIDTFITFKFINHSAVLFSQYVLYIELRSVHKFKLLDDPIILNPQAIDLQIIAVENLYDNLNSLWLRTLEGTKDTDCPTRY